ncbi:MAG: biopolymer transport protein ExbD [Paracoccaceae bacterium]|jgi:biopolymer transport protein ExbD
MAGNAALDEIMEEKCELQMTPMIDVTFLLLIFFMCTLKFKVLEGKLGAYLPKDVGVNTSEAEPKEKVDIRLDVIKKGRMMRWDNETKRPVPYTEADRAEGLRFFYDSTREIRYTVGPRRFTDLAEVTKALQSIKAREPDKEATIDPRIDVTTKDVVEALDAVMYAGYDNVTFKGSFEN